LITLDGEQEIDSFNRLDRDWRLVEPRQVEELASCMGPASRFGDRRRLAAYSVEPVEARIGVRLHQPGISRQMLFGMLGGAIGRVEEDRGRRIGAAKWPVVAHIGP
jgi:hypothetical protein